MNGAQWSLALAGVLLAAYILTPRDSGQATQESAPSTASAPTHRMTQDTWGCQQQGTLAHITELRAQGDMEATTAALSAGIDAQDCITLDRGDEVYLTDAAVLSGLSRVRKAGQTAAYWVAFEAVE